MTCATLGLNIADILVALEEAGFKAKLISIEEVN